MARTADDVEQYLKSLDRQFERDGASFLVASGAEGTPIALLVHETLLLLRVDIGKVPTDPARQLAVFRRLLELNGEDLVHAAYSLEGNEIVLDAGLPLENLDLNELASALSDVDLALVRHARALRTLAMG
jgi:hypothetical protein